MESTGTESLSVEFKLCWIVYGRSQNAFSEEGLPVGAGLEDLGKGLRSQVGTMYGTLAKGSRYLEMAEGYKLVSVPRITGFHFSGIVVSLSKNIQFESYERCIDKINEVLNSYGISSIEETEKITKDTGLDVYDKVKKLQPKEVADDGM